MRDCTFGIRVNFGLPANTASLWLCGGSLWDDRIAQSGGRLGKRQSARRFFYCFVRDRILRLKMPRYQNWGMAPFDACFQAVRSDSRCAESGAIEAPTPLLDPECPRTYQGVLLCCREVKGIPNSDKEVHGYI